MRNNIPTPAASPNPIRTVASIDTIEVFARWLPRGFRREVEAVTGERLMIERLRYGLMVKINRPPANVLPILDRLIKDRRYGACASRVDIANDLTVENVDAADQLTEWIDRHVVLKWRSPKTRKMEYGGTIYWCDKHKGRNIALYRKGDHVIRLELRFYRAQTLKRADLRDISDLPLINPKKLFDHHIKGRRLSEKFKINAMRRSVREDRARAQRNPVRSKFTDSYRANIGKRVAGLLGRIDGQSLGIKGKEDVSLEFLRIPHHLTWPALRTKGKLDGSGGGGGYYGMSEVPAGIG